VALASFLRTGVLVPVSLIFGLVTGVANGVAENGAAPGGVVTGKPAPLAGEGAAGGPKTGAEEAAEILNPATGAPGTGAAEAAKMLAPKAGEVGTGEAAAEKALAPAPGAVPPVVGKGPEVPKIGQSGLPLPRFVSLKSNRVNVRVGPGRDYEVAWVFTRGALPVEIVQEFDNWRKIRDSEGAEGWVFHSLLSGRRTVLIAPWEKGLPLTLTREANPASEVAALLEPGVLADVAECTGSWCLLTGDAFSGWIEQGKLWGVYPGEAFD